jgi:hypothetical protein
MLSSKIANLLPQLSSLPEAEQEAIAEYLYGELVDAEFRRKIEAGESMPAFEQALADAKANAAKGKTTSLDDWLAEDEQA